MDEWMDGWMDEWMDGWMNGWISSSFLIQLISNSVPKSMFALN
jgi:hypothetical protein